jgi:1-acyl-sn-glycerol-3-phosphate acyltransferase
MDPNQLRRIMHAVFFTLARVELVGLENIPEPGVGVLAAANHLSWLDGPLIYAVLPRADATALAALKYRRNAFSRWLLDSARVLWLDRDNPDPRALKDAIRFLKDGGFLGIAPEGTRSKTGALMEAKIGAAFLAHRAGVPMQAVAVTGTDRAFRSLLRFRRPHLRLEFSPPFDLPEFDRRNRDESLQRSADEIMCRIAALLPPEYRGVYAEHPRLREMLQDQ